MKKSILFIFLAVVVLLSSLGLASEAGAKPTAKPFVGGWAAKDIDGSRMKLAIGGGGNDRYNVNYTDFGASICGKDSEGKPLYAFKALGKGVATGNQLKVNFPAGYCMTKPKKLWGSLNFTYTYNPVNDTLWDGLVVWKRTSDK